MATVGVPRFLVVFLRGLAPSRENHFRIGVSAVNGDGSVTVDELIKGVNIARGTATVDTCQAMDANGDGAVTIDELIAAVNRALNGCASAES